MKSFILALIVVIGSLAFATGATITLTNKNGQSFDGELIGIQDQEVTVRRISDKKVFTLKRSSLNKETNEAIKKARESLPIVHPEYEIDVVIGKRTKDLKGSSRHHVQEVSCTVRVTNSDHSLPSPGVKGRAIFFGKELDRDEVYQVLATRDFEVSPGPDETKEMVLPNFKTEFYKSISEFGTIYEAHIIVLYGKDNKALTHKSPDALLTKAVEGNIGLLDLFRTIEEETYVNKEMQLTDYKGSLQ